MNIQEFFDVSYYDFPKVARSIYYSRSWDSMDDMTLTGSNMDLAQLLNEKDIVRALEAYEKAPLKHSGDHDLYCLFRCYQYSVWGIAWNRAELVQEWQALNNPHDDSDTEMARTLQDIYIANLEHIQNECDEDDIVNDLLCSFTEKSSAKSCFVINGLALEECVLCRNKHDAMMYQLLMYLAYPEQARNGRTITHCKQCGDPFIRGSKNAKYCSKCSTSAARVMRCRRKKAASGPQED